jgi:glutamyl-tRNA reductase
MNFLLTGLNHKTAPVDLRERLNIPAEELPSVTEQVLELPGVQEAMILSTCNRVEILIAHRAPKDQEGVEPDVADFLEQRFGLADSDLRAHLYHFREMEAVRHMFRVACSLDSLVLGEPQILGQVKAAYNSAREQGAIGSQLDRLLQDTFALAKRVRTETEIGASPVSISTVAVDLARRIFGDLDGKRVMLVGAGKMSELAARHLIHHGAERILVANRTFSRAESLAQKFGGRALEFDSIYTMPDPSDILITSTGSAQPILSAEHIQQFLQRRRRKPILIIDIAVPRDVDPEVNRLEGAFLYDIDDLQSVANSNLGDRKQEAAQAEEIVAEEALRFEQRRRALDVGPMIAAMQHTIEHLCQAEMKRVGPRMQSFNEEQQAVIKMFARGLTNKFLHLPMHALRNAAQSGDVDAVRAIQAAFDPSGLRDFTPDKDTCPHTGIRIEEVRVDPEDSDDEVAAEPEIPAHLRQS